MPKVRAYTSSYTTSTTGTTITVPVPAYQENDLLIVSMVSDTGSTSTTWALPSGWNYFIRRVFTGSAQLDVFYKTASASEPADYTFTRSLAETFNARMISIADVNTSAPFGFTPAYTGPITIAVNATARTFTRSAGGSGSFITDGFAAGQTIITSGFTNAGNNTTKVIQSVTTTVITVTDGSGLVTEAAATNRYIWSGNAVISIANATAGVFKYTMPQITTTVDNCLILYLFANANAAVPSIIEGPVTQISGEDGSAESGGEGWTFKPIAGTTPNNVVCSNVSTGTIISATIQISPPTSGAQIIPTFCAADASIYVDPINGTTAYNNNGSLTNTFNTLISSTIAGRAVVAPTAIAAVADYGLNSFHSVGQVSSVNASTAWAGASLSLATTNYVNADEKNILLHTGPNNPSHIQRFAPAASKLGIAIALRSSTGNWKAWHVHGRGSPFGARRDVPLIVNPNNTSGVIDSGGTLDPSSIDTFGFAVTGTAVGSTLWQFYSLWVLDTTTICGGNSNYPIDIAGIVEAASTGHERNSVIQQGTNQAIVYQPIQFGDGGTNPTYLDLNATAIEFPQQYNLSKLQVNYCSADDVAGITYYAGASDVIKHRNSVISSPSRYHWRIHPSSSASATYDFSGLSVIGAGTISLNRPITISQLTINNYSTLDISNLTLNNSNIINPPNTNNSITVNSSTTLNSCSIDVTTLSAGNYLFSTTTPDKISNCYFTGSSNKGHAIRITSTGIFTLSGNVFSGFGNDGTTSAAIFNDSGGLVTLNITNGGNTPTVRNGTGASTVINNAVNLTVTIKNENGTPIENARVAIQKIASSSVTGALFYNGSSYTNETIAANNSTANDMTLLRSSPVVGDIYYFGGKEPFYKLRINIGTAGVGTWAITWEYYNGSTWSTINDLYDGTSGFKAGTGNKDVLFSPPSNWVSTSVNGIPAFWLRARLSSFTSMTTQPKGTQAWVYLQIMNKLTDSSGIAQESYSYTEEEDVNVIIRKSSTGSTRYYPVTTIQTITSTGLSLTWTLIEDKIAQ